MNEEITNSFDVLVSATEAIKDSDSQGIIKSAVCIELTLGSMMPFHRKILWDYLCKSRKALGNKIFEDDDDIADFLMSKGLGGGVISDG